MNCKVVQKKRIQATEKIAKKEIQNEERSPFFIISNLIRALVNQFHLKVLKLVMQQIRDQFLDFFMYEDSGSLQILELIHILKAFHQLTKDHLCINRQIQLTKVIIAFMSKKVINFNFSTLQKVILCTTQGG